MISDQNFSSCCLFFNSRVSCRKLALTPHLYAIRNMQDRAQDQYSQNFSCRRSPFLAFGSAIFLDVHTINNNNLCDLEGSTTQPGVLDPQKQPSENNQYCKFGYTFAVKKLPMPKILLSYLLYISLSFLEFFWPLASTPRPLLLVWQPAFAHCRRPHPSSSSSDTSFRRCPVYCMSFVRNVLFWQPQLLLVVVVVAIFIFRYLFTFTSSAGSQHQILRY